MGKSFISVVAFPHENAGQKPMPAPAPIRFLTAMGESDSKIIFGLKPAERQNLSHMVRNNREPARLTNSFSLTSFKSMNSSLPYSEFFGTAR